ncbi:PoNe immunity protein domain-containing protein [Chryseolinea lacunae]|uniref:DUF1911 domain-containing protein n=1 Tax=Chryseolinea lacunae TaxID=2801331 RepID=A0ABS1KV30_9BACT|nr:PoNe immunity protein domain-containing protein [Chryseolinea lacunae]MBL0743195.1 DUF1911 domain-containing protein [Chryseolinea lacunae]
MRVAFKTPAYFHQYIALQNETSEAFLSCAVAEWTRWNKASARHWLVQVGRHLLRKLVAQYSAGKSMGAVKRTFAEIRYYLGKTDNTPCDPTDLLWMFSLAVLLRLPHSQIQPFIQLARTQHPNHYLLHYLLARFDPTHPLPPLPTTKDPHQNLALATQQRKHFAQRRIKNYLDKQWYAAHANFSWHESHTSAHYNYFGYWSFESAAITIVLKLDDSAYRDNPYYPKDLVDYARRKQKPRAAKKIDQPKKN